MNIQVLKARPDLRAANYVSAMPASVSGRGGHTAAFAAARALIHGFALSEDIALGILLAHFNPRCAPPWSETELRHKVRSAGTSTSARLRGHLLGRDETPLPSTAARQSPRWPAVNYEQREAIVASGLGVADLYDASPLRMDAKGNHAEDIADALFPGDPLLCCGWTKSDFATRPRSAWQGKLPRLALIVPSPMSAPTGRTKAGKPSAHALANTGPRRFLIIEQDTGTTDEQAAVLLHLAMRAPLALAVHSGGKSIHGWFFCQGRPEDHLRAFLAYAVSLGADPALWTRSQFARMPEGTRENGARQPAPYFNPEALPS